MIKRQNELFRNAFKFHVADLTGRGFSVTTGESLDRWQKFMVRMKDKGHTARQSPSFKAFSDVEGQGNYAISPDNADAIMVHHDGEAVGAICVRRYDGDVRSVVLSGNMWRSAKDLIVNDDVIYDWPKSFPSGGECAQVGGSFVDPAFQGIGIGSTLGMLGRYWTFLRWPQLEFSVGLRESAEGRCAVSVRQAPIMEGSIPAPRRKFDLTMVTRYELSTAAEHLEKTGKPTLPLWQMFDSRCHDEMPNISFMADHRHDQAPVE